MGKDTIPPAETKPPEQEHLEELVKRAWQGDESVLSELRQQLELHTQLWRACGDLAAQARQAWLNLVGGVDLVLKEAVQRHLDEMQLELSGPSPTPLESLLVQRVLVAWMQVYYADTISAQAQERKVTGAVLGELQKRQESAGRCLTEAVKQLELARRMVMGKRTPVRLAALDLPGMPLRREGGTGK